MESSNKIIEELKEIRMHKYMAVWESFFKKHKIDTICELGVQRGRHFGRMISHNPKLAVAIDCWKDTGMVGQNDTGFEQKELDEQYEEFKNGIGNKPFVKIYKDFTFNVAKEFPDEFFDFVFIDADHTFEGCSQDINDWYPKVKKERILCGHDYNHKVYRTRRGEKCKFGVVEAVDKFVKDNNIETFFRLPHTIWGLIK